LKCWLKGGSYTPYFTHQKTVWYYNEDYKTTGAFKGVKGFTSRNKALKKCGLNTECKSVHYTGKKYHMRTGKKLTDKDGDKAWVKGTSNVDFSKVTVTFAGLLFNPRPSHTLKGKIGKKTYKVLPKAAAACAANPKCKGLVLNNKTKKFTLHSKGDITKKTGYTAYPRKYPCDGAGNCKAVKKGKVITIDMKYCFTLKKLEIGNKQKCCSKNSGNVVIKVGKKTCGTVAMSGKTTALRTECASKASGKKITFTFANIGDINLNSLYLETVGSDDC